MKGRKSEEYQKHGGSTLVSIGSLMGGQSGVVLIWVNGRESRKSLSSPSSGDSRSMPLANILRSAEREEEGSLSTLVHTLT